MIKHYLVLAAAAGFVPFEAALAQADMPAAVASQAQEADTEAVNEVIVTARKRAESAKDVPISLTVLTGKSIEERGVRQLQDMMQYAPDFQQSNGAIGAFRTMRGGGSVGSNFSFEQSVGLFFDEVSFGRNAQSRIPIFDMERAEVLRGPQVISFGNSTTAGAVSLVTRKPGSRFEANLTTSYEFEHRQFVAEGGMTLPVSERVSVRISGITDQLQKGWLEVIDRGKSSFEPRNDISAGRIILGAKPNEDLDITLKYEHDNIRFDGSSLVSTTNRNNFPFIPSTEFTDVAYRGSPDPFNVEPSLRMKNDTVQAMLDYRIGGVTLTSNTAWWRYDYIQFEDADTTPAPIAVSSPRDDFRQFSQEFRVAGQFGTALEYLAGVYFQSDEQIGRFSLSGNRAALGVANPPPAFGRVTGVEQEADTWSAFVDLTFHATENLTVNPGVRYTDIRRKGRQFAYGTEILSVTPTNQYDAFLLAVFGAVPHDFALSAPESHTMPQLIVSYAPNGDTNVFAKFVQGAKTGGLDFNYAAGDPTQAQFKAEEVTDYELGVKSELLNGDLSVALTAFHSKYKDLQLSIFSVNRFVLRNAGGQLSKGLELDLTWRTPLEGFTFGLSGAYLDAKYTDFQGATCTLDQAFSRPPPCTQDLTGGRSGFSSKWYGSLVGQYERIVGGYSLDFTLDGNYRSSYSPTTNNDPVGRQDPNTLINVRVAFAPVSGPWHVALFGRNLTNEIYSNFYSPNGAVLTPGASLASLERTRQYGLELGLRF